MKTSGQKLAAALEKEFGPLEKISIKIKFKKAVDRFINEIEKAHKAAGKSKLVFKGLI